jgi:hypothetical protein
MLIILLACVVLNVLKVRVLTRPHIGQLFRAAGQQRKKDVDFAAAMMRGIPGALILERQFDHLLQNHDATSKGLGDIFDSIFSE